MADATQITLNDEDIEAIVRTAATEVGHGGYLRSHPETIRAMAEAVADTILNRVASPQFPDSVSDVVNEPWQFSAINAGDTRYNPRVYGSWQNVPESAVHPELRASLEGYIQGRLKGAPSRLEQMGVPDAVNFANPGASSPANRRGWIADMQRAGAQRLGIGSFEHYHGTAPGSIAAAASLAPPQFGPPISAMPPQPQFANVPSPSFPPGSPASPLPAAPVSPVEVAAVVQSPRARPGSAVSSLAPSPVTPVESRALEAIETATRRPDAARLAEAFADLSARPSSSLRRSPSDFQYNDQDNRAVERELARENRDTIRISRSNSGFEPTTSAETTSRPTERREETTPRLSESYGNRGGNIYETGQSSLSNVFESAPRATRPEETTPRLSETTFQTASREVANPDYSAWESTFRSIDQASPTDFQYAAQDARTLARAAAGPAPPRTITVTRRVPVTRTVQRTQPRSSSSGVNSFVDGMRGSVDRGYTEDSRGRTGWGLGRSNSYQRNRSGSDGSRAYGGRDQSFTENARSSSWGRSSSRRSSSRRSSSRRSSDNGSSGSSGGGGTVICTYFWQQGEITNAEYMINVRFTKERCSDQKVRGYHAWAIPYVWLMRRSNMARAIMLPLLKWRTDELAYQLGRRPAGSWKGKLARLMFEPASWVIGLFVCEQDWAPLWEGQQLD